MKLRNTFYSLVALFTIQFSFAQSTPAQNLSLDSGTIDDQFEFVIKKSSNWQEFEVIKKTWMAQLRSHVNDTLAKNKLQFLAAQKTISEQQSQISSLKSSLEDTQSNLSSVTAERDNISFFGLATSKGVYKSIMWGIVAGLFALFLFFVFKFKNSNVITQEAKQNLAELEEEYEIHRRTALEREQKVRRQLQDEINKNKALSKT
ncbi:tRNA (guanine-N1)-methyltransferase [Sungkyunkwania multivorans]|uniref:tRNA (Guanine-N1)-methyltransferase n=1 Tax=Sungkyunkwania multivorans TaxID=1173618 RepID=A0ABW3CZR0_9FLAO